MTEEMVGGQHRSDESGHGTEAAGVNTMRAKDRRRYVIQSVARVCPEEANTQEKILATADLIRDSAFPRT